MVSFLFSKIKSVDNLYLNVIHLFFLFYRISEEYGQILSKTWILRNPSGLFDFTL